MHGGRAPVTRPSPPSHGRVAGLPVRSRQTRMGTTRPTQEDDVTEPAKADEADVLEQEADVPVGEDDPEL